MKKTCLIIAGPTASGKTNFAIELAKHFNTEIISADSRQCFKELNIGVAKPTAEQLQQVKHHFINSHSIKDDVNAAYFESYAMSAIEKIFENNDVAVMVGGTGLYIKAFCEGVDMIPPISPALRQSILDQYVNKGLRWLQNELKESDPRWYAAGEIKNPQRMMRALEVVKGTGKSILDFQKGEKAARNFRIVKIAPDIARDQLYNNINSRVDEMITAGLADEVKQLMPYRKLNALQTVGYAELFDYYNGKISLEKAIDDIKKNTRHYAKRQVTWFKKDAEIKWLKTDGPTLFLSLALEALQE
jgi:tRNA dimethylallyltransferase